MGSREGRLAGICGQTIREDAHARWREATDAARAALEGAGITLETPYQANDWRDLVAFVSACLAVETNMPYMAKIKDWHEVPVEGGLPPLPDFGVFLYVREDASPLALQLAGIIRDVDFDPSAIAKRG